jgi:hypothetical protein
MSRRSHAGFLSIPKTVSRARETQAFSRPLAPQDSIEWLPVLLSGDRGAIVDDDELASRGGRSAPRLGGLISKFYQ